MDFTIRLTKHLVWQRTNLFYWKISRETNVKCERNPAYLAPSQGGPPMQAQPRSWPPLPRNRICQRILSGIYFMESIPGLLKRLQIWSHAGCCLCSVLWADKQRRFRSILVWGLKVVLNWFGWNLPPHTTYWLALVEVIWPINISTIKKNSFDPQGRDLLGLGKDYRQEEKREYTTH